MDAHDKRVALVYKANDLMKSGRCSCWTEVLDHMSRDILSLAQEIHKSSAYVFACLVDDVEAGLGDD